MLKILSFLGVVAISMSYAVGFIYDSAYIEYYGVSCLELVATPWEYLAIGGFFVLSAMVSKFVAVFFIPGLIACALKPVLEILRNWKIGKYIDIESLPYIIISLSIPTVILCAGLIVGVGKEDAKIDIQKLKKVKEINYSINGKLLTANGLVVRNRNGMILFYDADKKSSFLVPQSNVEMLKNY